MADERQRRPGSHRDYSAPKQHRTPQEVPIAFPEEVTGQFRGEELEFWRGKRPTEQRFAHIEKRIDTFDTFKDEIKDEIGELGKQVAGISGQMMVIPDLVEALTDATKEMRQREHVTLTAKVDVDRQRALDPLEERKFRRNLILQIAGGVFSVSVLVAFITLFAKQC